MSDASRDIHIVAVVGSGGSIRLDRLPLQAGQTVDITVHPVANREQKPLATRSLAGLPVEYEAPFSGVDENDWEAAR